MNKRSLFISLSLILSIALAGCSQRTSDQVSLNEPSTNQSREQVDLETPTPPTDIVENSLQNNASDQDLIDALAELDTQLSETVIDDESFDDIQW